MMGVKSKYKMTEFGEIPFEWEVKKLGEMFKVKSGEGLSAKNIVAGPYPVYGGNGITGFHNDYLFDEVLLVIGRVGELCGNVNLIRGKSWITDNALYICKHIEEFNDKFMFYSLTSIGLNNYANKNAQPLISGSIIYNIIIYLPSIEEQQKIAEILSTVDKQIEQTDQLIEKTKELKKGLMQQLLTKGIRHTEFKKTKTGEIPIEWKSVKFKEVCSIVNGLVDPREKPYSDYPHIGNANIEKKSGKLLNYRIAKEENLISGKYLFNEKHVLYGKINPQFAKVAYPKFVGLCSADMYPIECNLEQILPEFLLYTILDTRFTDTMVKLSTRTGMPKVNRFEVEQYVFALPTVNEQKQIAKVLTSVDEDIEGYEEEKAKYEELKKGLMQQLLTGKTRVKVD